MPLVVPAGLPSSNRLFHMGYSADRPMQLSVRIRLRPPSKEMMIVPERSLAGLRADGGGLELCMTTYKVGCFVGSLAKASINRKLA